MYYCKQTPRMFKKLSVLLVLFVFSISIYAQEKALIKGMKITTTTKIKKGVYRIDAPANAGSSAVPVLDRKSVV